MQIARLLLAYGADPDQRAVTGMSARRMHHDDPDLKLLLQAHDEMGAMAFEDPPATWRRVQHDDSGACCDMFVCPFLLCLPLHSTGGYVSRV